MPRERRKSSIWAFIALDGTRVRGSPAFALGEKEHLKQNSHYSYVPLDFFKGRKS